MAVIACKPLPRKPSRTITPLERLEWGREPLPPRDPVTSLLSDWFEPSGGFSYDSVSQARSRDRVTGQFSSWLQLALGSVVSGCYYYCLNNSVAPFVTGTGLAWTGAPGAATSERTRLELAGARWRLQQDLQQAVSSPHSGLPSRNGSSERIQ